MHRTTRRHAVLARLVGAALMLPLTALPVLIGLAVTDRVSARLRASGRDAGVSAVEWVLITAVAVTIVAAVAVVIRQRITDKANSLDLTTP